MTLKIGINGFGRIGRPVFRIAHEKFGHEVEIAMINTSTDTKMLAHLLKYDSIYGKFHGVIEVKENSIIVDGREILVTRERDPEKIKWAEAGVDIVVESTGKFIKREDAMKHIKAGAKKVIISAPAKNEDITIVMGVNEDKYDPENHNIISNASCTTNCLAPIVKVLHERFGIVNGLMNTIHSYTNDQQILDKSHKDFRRARAGALSIIPTTTGAAKAVTLVIPEMAGKLTGLSLRVPTPAVSVVDLVINTEKNVTVKEVNKAFIDASAGRYKGIIEYCDEPLVSTDFMGNSHSAIVDGLCTMVIGEKMLKVLAWYDNEWGYSTRIIDLIKYMSINR